MALFLGSVRPRSARTARYLEFCHQEGGAPPSSAANGRSAAGRAGREPPLLAKTVAALADFTAVAIAMALAYQLRILLPLETDQPLLGRHALVGVVSLPLWIAVFARYQLYRHSLITSRLREFKQVVHAFVAGLFVTAGMGLLLQQHISRGWLTLLFALGVVGIVVEREIVRSVFAALRRRGRLLRRILVVGANAESQRLCDTMQTDLTLGYRVVGVVGDRASADAAVAGGVPVLGAIDDLPKALALTGARHVLIATTAVSWDTTNQLTRQLSDAGVQVELSSALRDTRAERLSVRSLGHCPVIHVEPVRRNGWRACAKRSFDVVVAAVVLSALSPLLALIAVLVKLDSPGTALFRQERVGQDGRLFAVLKFRTMVSGAEQLKAQLLDHNEADGPLFKMRRDPRVTRLGRLLRASSLDELPQLWNVLRNDMSIVGPRPALPQEVEDWDPELHQRLRVKPGLTGMWQVNGRTEIPFSEYMRLDLYYIDNWSLWTDLTIVAKTIPTVLFRRGY